MSASHDEPRTKDATMTTIHLSTTTKRNDGRYQVFGNYDGADDRYTFAVQSFASMADAERYAGRVAEIHGAVVVKD
jgi:hypothetical protein